MSTVWPIVLYGHPALRRACRHASVDTTGIPMLKTLAGELEAARVAADGVGIAANQLAMTRALCVVAPPGRTAQLLINPEIVDHSGRGKDGLEGCLSIPGYEFTVNRPNRVTVHAWTCDVDSGVPEERTFEAHGYYARVICHEVDHLNGLTIAERAPETQRIRFLRALLGTGSMPTADMVAAAEKALPSMSQSIAHPLAWETFVRGSVAVAAAVSGGGGHGNGDD
jgi:peptide deformylase